ncbi:MAG: hypothetical protein WCI51_00685 [Lentisphaerota bacterium]
MTISNGRQIWSGTILFAVLIILIILIVCIPSSAKNGKRAAVGHSGSPLTASLYAAANIPSWNKEFVLAKFGTSADVAYALLANDITAGFVDPSKALAIKDLPAFKNLTVIGQVTFPYGATLIVRKDLNFRLCDLPGRKVAVASKSCKLLHAFKADAARFGVNAEKINYEYMSFDTMIPALEAGKIDGAIIKGSYAVIAQKLGHSILYQKWDMEAGDTCCPAVITQVEYVLLAQKQDKDAAGRLLMRLAEAEKLTPAELRIAVSKSLNIPEKTLTSLPLAVFQPADADILKLFDIHLHDEAVNEHEEHKGKSKR